MALGADGTFIDDETEQALLDAHRCTSCPNTASERALSRRQVLAALGLACGSAALAACGAAGVAERPTAQPTAPGATPGQASPPPAAGATPCPSATSSAMAPAPGPARAPVAQGSAGPASPPRVAGRVPSRTADNPIVRENRRPGTRAWDDRRTRLASAYLAVPSVAPGEPLALRASGVGEVGVEWYRLGWYGGKGGRLVAESHGVKLHRHDRLPPDPATGLVEARWPTVLTTTAPTGVESGMLLAVLRRPDGHVVANVPVVLRPDPTATRRAPVLFISAAATWQAYNPWGGLDLYTNEPRLAIPVTGGHRSNRAAIVSFDRPYLLDGGAAYLRRWELQFIRWMERQGRDVEYCSDMDLELNPGLVAGRRMLVMAGHPEYWSRPMRETVEAAVATGVNVAFLTANEVYWQVRLEDGPAGPASRIVCYKSQSTDPITATQPDLTTCRWREPRLRNPEATLVGQMYAHVNLHSDDWVAKGTRHWLYEGTRMHDGDRITHLVGQEYDTFWPELAQPGTIILAESPVNIDVKSTHDPGAEAAPEIHNATIYTADSGATVFAAGTFQWSWALEPYGTRWRNGTFTPLDPRVGRMTRNLFDRLGDGPLIA